MATLPTVKVVNPSDPDDYIIINEDDFDPDRHDRWDEDSGGSSGPLAGVDFASDEAAEAASEAGLSAEDFEGVEPSGKTGYTKADAEELALRDEDGESEAAEAASEDEAEDEAAAQSES